MSKLLYVAAGALLLALVGSGAAENVTTVGEGSVNADGYTWKSPYWWYDAVPYVRTQVAYSVPYTSYTYSYGYGYPTTYYKTEYRYQYTAVALPKAADPDFRAKLIDLAAQQRKAEQALLKTRVDQEAFEASVKALGLDSTFKYAGLIGSPYNGSPYQAGYAATYGATGTTVYGHSYQQVADLYGQADLNILYQAAGRANERAGQLLGQSNTELSEVVKLANQGLAKAAEITAKGQAAAAALAAIRPEPSQHIETRQFSFSLTPDGQLKTVRAEMDGPTFRANACGACHSGNVVKGKFDVSRFAEFTPAEKARMLEVVTTRDAAERMPRDSADPSKPGPVMTPEQVQLLFK